MANVINKQRALITGAEGFTGRYMIERLTLAGFEVLTSTQAQLNLCDRNNVVQFVKEIQPDVVVHLAAISSVTENNLTQMYETNLMGTLYLLEALAEIKTPRAILLASSANIYGNRSSGLICEAQQPEPINDYAASKYAMEIMATQWMSKLPIFIVRPFNYTGLGQSSRFLIPKIIQHFQTKSDHIELGNLDVWREFNDVRFVSDVYTQLLERAPIGKTINICTGQVYSLREIIALCEQITGHTLELRVNPQFVRLNEVHTLQGDNRLLRDLIGEVQPPSLEDTLRWMLLNE